MAPKPKKNKFKAFNADNLQEIETKLKESPVNVGKSRKSPRRPGNPSDKNTTIATENSSGNVIDDFPILKHDKDHVKAQNIQENPTTSSGNLEYNNSKCLPDADTHESFSVHDMYQSLPEAEKPEGFHGK